MESLFAAAFDDAEGLIGFVNENKISRKDILTITANGDKSGFTLFYYSVKEY